MAAQDQSIIVILGDQLSLRLASLRQGNPERDIILMAEVMTENTYARHHRKKIVLVLSAMRHFANTLRAAGWQVDYVLLTDPDNTGTLTGEIERAKARHGINHVAMTEPGEWRLTQALQHITQAEDDRFICTHAAFRQWAASRKELRMEYFYRDMRRQTGLLMDGDAPVGGQWNYDSDNRKPAKADFRSQQPLRFAPDDITQSVIDLVKEKFTGHPGDVEPFWFPVTSRQAEQSRDHFLKYSLPRFGETQDAMLQGEYYLHHAVLSPLLNIGLLDPLDVCRKVEEQYRNGKVPLAAAEGFIRQVIGWREYIRGIYWLKMPAYRDVNVLNATRPLPDFYWTGDTSMNCVAQVVKQTMQEAYAHHIQRLMITGNFALLAGLDPVAVHEWYLAVYADAFEWVELPNTIGMALHADGGLLGSKPYAASGNYINKMSDYCKSCSFDVKKRTGDGACPFNALYWDFIERHKPKFARNPRMAQTCRSHDNFPDDEKDRIRSSAGKFLSGLHSSGRW
jgi:deoxyribodipyrimidine photolyase-related protein